MVRGKEVETGMTYYVWAMYDLSLLRLMDTNFIFPKCKALLFLIYQGNCFENVSLILTLKME